MPFEVPWEFRRWQDGRVLFSSATAPRGRRASARRTSRSIARTCCPCSLTRCRRGSWRWGAASRPSEDGEVAFEDGSSERFDVLIGADGIHSVVRAAMLGAESPVFTGLAAYRALVPAAEAPEFARRPVCSIWLGPGRHFVHYPVSAGREVNLVTANPAGDWREESWTAEGPSRTSRASSRAGPSRSAR